jgi:hypothetical protein
MSRDIDFTDLFDEQEGGGGGGSDEAVVDTARSQSATARNAPDVTAKTMRDHETMQREWVNGVMQSFRMTSSSSNVAMWKLQWRTTGNRQSVMKMSRALSEYTNSTVGDVVNFSIIPFVNVPIVLQESFAQTLMTWPEESDMPTHVMVWQTSQESCVSAWAFMPCVIAFPKHVRDAHAKEWDALASVKKDEAPIMNDGMAASITVPWKSAKLSHLITHMTRDASVSRISCEINDVDTELFVKAYAAKDKCRGSVCIPMLNVDVPDELEHWNTEAKPAYAKLKFPLDQWRDILKHATQTKDDKSADQAEVKTSDTSMDIVMVQHKRTKQQFILFHTVQEPCVTIVYRILPDGSAQLIDLNVIAKTRSDDDELGDLLESGTQTASSSSTSFYAWVDSVSKMIGKSLDTLFRGEEDWTMLARGAVVTKQWWKWCKQLQDGQHIELYMWREKDDLLLRRMGLVFGVHDCAFMNMQVCALESGWWD